MFNKIELFLTLPNLTYFIFHSKHFTILGKTVSELTEQQLEFTYECISFAEWVSSRSNDRNYHSTHTNIYFGHNVWLYLS
jgi:hypothetical protein